MIPIIKTLQFNKNVYTVRRELRLIVEGEIHEAIRT